MNSSNLRKTRKVGHEPPVGKLKSFRAIRRGAIVEVMAEDLPADTLVRVPLAEAERLGVKRLDLIAKPKLGVTKGSIRVIARGRRRTKLSASEAKAEPATSISEHALSAIREDAFAPSFRAKALLRGVEIAQEDLRSSGGAFALEDVQLLLRGASQQSVEARVRSGSLLAVPGPRNTRLYPVVQFKDDGELIEGLDAVQEALPTTNSFAVLNFLIHPDDRLGGRRPIDLLKAREVGQVVEVARRYAVAGG